MNFEFDTYSDEEINSTNLLMPGECNFEVVKAKAKTSKSLNSMLELQLKVWDSTGKDKLIFDYLVNLQTMAFKIKHFCQAVGIDYSGSFSAEMCEGKSGKLKLGIQKDKTGQYQDKNSVIDYLPAKQEEKAKKEDPFFDDDINL